MAYGTFSMEFMEELAANDAKRQYLIDVRPPEYYAQGHIPGAINISMLEAKQTSKDPGQVMANALEALGIGKNDGIYIYCQDGQLAAEADALISGKGFTRTYLFESCYPEWASNPAHPVER